MELGEKIRFIQDALERMAWHTYPYLASVIGVEDEHGGQHVGSALRIRAGTRRGIITAAHMIEQARSSYTRLAVSAVLGSPPYEIAGDPHRVALRHDLAIYFLPDDYPEAEGIGFWPCERADVSEERLSTDLLFVHGFPSVRSQLSTSGGDVVSRSLPYGVMRREDDLPEHIAAFQLAMNLDPEKLEGPARGTVDWLDPYGLPGSPVWRIGASGRLVDQWSPELSLTVGILTRWMPDEKLLVATKWKQVLELLEGG
ncbi:MAG TPA: hypothetical protein VLS89_19245 [Candidatus Nanopelagicales bacterium]|nr:hypothetical protein [Candidatus Nanopelagicales bacterium]